MHGQQSQRLRQLRHLRRQYQLPPRQKSTKAFSRWPNPNAAATSRICALWPHSRASSAVVIHPIRITCALRNQEPWASKSAMSSPCRSAGAIIASCIRPATKSTWWNTLNIDATAGCTAALGANPSQRRPDRDAKIRCWIEPKQRLKTNGDREADRCQPTKRQEQHRPDERSTASAAQGEMPSATGLRLRP